MPIINYVKTLWTDYVLIIFIGSKLIIKIKIKNIQVSVLLYAKSIDRTVFLPFLGLS